MPDRAKTYPVFTTHDTPCSDGLPPCPRATRIYKSPRFLFFFLRKRFCISLNVWQRKAWSYKLHPWSRCGSYCGCGRPEGDCAIKEVVPVSSPGIYRSFAISHQELQTGLVF